MARTRPQDGRQLTLDFESPRREEFAQLVSAMTVAGANEKVRSVVLLVYNVAGSAGKLMWSLERIGGEFARSRQAARRWIRQAEDFGLLTVDERRECAGGQRVHALSINWDGVKGLALDRGIKTIPRGIKVIPRGIKPDTPYKEIQFSYHSCTTHSSPLARSAAAAATPGAGCDWDRTSWQEAEEEVFLCGVDQAAKAIEAARSRGAGPADVHAIVAEFEKLRSALEFPEAALYRRLLRWSPDLPAERGWPAEGPREEARRRRERELAEQLRKATRRRGEVRQANVERQRDAERERTWGPKLDALSAAECDQLAVAALGGNSLLLARYRRDGRLGNLVRPDLLTALQAECERAELLRDERKNS